MSKGIKISNVGEDLAGKNPHPIPDKDRKLLPSLLYSVALPYLSGAKTQIIRYKDAQRIRDINAVEYVYACMHEVSCLFEDLNTVAKYAKMCGNDNDLHQLWLDVRNHIRHDIREEMDVENKRTKNNRAKRLGIKPNLQMKISYDTSCIQVGAVNIKIDMIEEYINWAENIIDKVMEEGIKSGHIKGMALKNE